MKKILAVLVTVVVLASCQRDVNEVVATNLPAQTLTNVSYGNDTAQKMDIYLPAGRIDTTKLIVMVHGGAWAVGSKADFTPYVPTLQQRFPGYAIANINYRLATALTNHFPTQENDMKAAIDFLVQKRSEYHISQKIVLLGASAGAHMALLQAYKYSSPKVLAVVDFFGPTDMAALYDFYNGSMNQFAFQLLLNGTPATNAALYASSSPINYVTAQSCPTIILHGTVDDIVPFAQSTALKTKLQSFGVVNELHSYTSLGHDVWPSATMNDAFNKIEVFLKANVH